MLDAGLPHPTIPDVHQETFPPPSFRWSTGFRASLLAAMIPSSSLRCLLTSSSPSTATIGAHLPLILPGFPVAPLARRSLLTDRSARALAWCVYVFRQIYGGEVLTLEPKGCHILKKHRGLCRTFALTSARLASPEDDDDRETFLAWAGGGAPPIHGSSAKTM